MFTDIQVFPVNGHAKILARGSFLYNGAFQINYTLFKGNEGPYVGLPGKWGQATNEDGSKKWYSDVFCKNKDVVKAMNKAVVDRYNSRLKSAPENENQSQGEDTIPF